LAKRNLSSPTTITIKNIYCGQAGMKFFMLPLCNLSLFKELFGEKFHVDLSMFVTIEAEKL
jgi:hypothetical protein